MTTPPARPIRARGLGVFAIAFLVISAASPLSVVLGSAPLALLFGGPAAAVGFLIIGAVLAIFSVSFLSMTKYVSEPGAFYAYVDRGLGRAMGNGVALMTLLSYTALAVCGFSLFGLYASQVWGALAGSPVDWWVFSLIAIVIVGALGQLNISVNAGILGILLVVEMIVLAIIAGAILGAGGADGLSFDAFAPEHVFSPGMAIAILFAFASCLGLESTVVYRREARNPDRTIPVALFSVIGFVALFHAFFLWLIVQAGGAGLWEALAADPAGTVLGLADAFAGPWASPVLSLLVLASILASCLAFHNMLNRYARKLADDRLMPPRFADVSRLDVPYLAGIVQIALALVVVLISVLLGLDPYLQTYILVSTPGVFGMVITLGVTALAALVFFLRIKDVARRGALIVTSSAATLLFGGGFILAIQQIDYLTGLGPLANTLLLLPPLIAFVVGLVLTLGRTRGATPPADVEPVPAERMRTE